VITETFSLLLRVVGDVVRVCETLWINLWITGCEQWNFHLPIDEWEFHLAWWWVIFKAILWHTYTCLYLIKLTERTICTWNLKLNDRRSTRLHCVSREYFQF
jgi:hypothetical protein